jgi:hypothetical protein
MNKGRGTYLSVSESILHFDYLTPKATGCEYVLLLPFSS